jgi:hypothetical protein
LILIKLFKPCQFDQTREAERPPRGGLSEINDAKGLHPAGRGSCQDILARCAKFGDMRLYTSCNSAAARFYVCTERFDIVAACPPTVCNRGQNGPARRAKVRYMRVNAGTNAALTRLHAPTRRPDILGTNPCGLSLLRHCACCREQHDGTDCKNIL